MNGWIPEANAIFLEALDLPPESERHAFLQQKCGGDTQLRSRVEALLAASERAGAFLENPPTDVAEAVETLATAEPPRALPNTAVGPYRLLERIGEGGFGEVWLAEQREPRRNVALKIVKAGMDTRQVIARFEAERQALAMMDHPNIARVFDGGATDLQSPLGPGHPYFAMELVRGVPITRYCDENRLALRERLALFMDVCHAVQHAHQKGIIHRDLKPSNILVTPVEGGLEASGDRGAWASGPPASPGAWASGPRGERGASASCRFGDPRASASGRSGLVKIIDFGIAKAISGMDPLTDKTLITEARQLIGTPAYMSPEQAGLSDMDIDTRSDIYSLGVLLYELLTGTAPFDTDRLRRADFDELRRIIRQEDPPKPSTRLSSLQFVASDPRFGRLSEPVAPATGSSAFSNLKSEFSDSSSSPSCLRASLIRGDLDWIVMKCLEKDRTRRYETANGLATDVQRHLAGETVVAVPPSAAYRARKFIRRHRVGVLAGSLVAATLVLGLIGTSVGVFWALDERDQALAAKAQETRERERADAQATEARTQAEIADAARQETRNSFASLADFLENQAKLAEAEPYYRQVLEKCRRDLGDENRVTLVWIEAMADVLKVQDKFVDAEPLYQEALETHRRLSKGDDRDVARILNKLARMRNFLGRAAEAESLDQQALEINQRVFEGDDPAVATSLNNLAYKRQVLGRDAEAEPLYRRALEMCWRLYPTAHSDTAMVLHHLADALRAQGKVDEAEPLAREALAMYRENPDWPLLEAVHAAQVLWTTLIETGRLADAVETARDFVAWERQHTRANENDQVTTLARFGGSLVRAGTPAAAKEAEPFLRECLAIRERIHPDGHPEEWLRYNTMSLLGGAILGQVRDPALSLESRIERLREAELLLLAGYNGMKDDLRVTPPGAIGGGDRKREALERIVVLYESWHDAEPNVGHDAQAGRWRQHLDRTEPHASERSPPGPSP